MAVLAPVQLALPVLQVVRPAMEPLPTIVLFVPVEATRSMEAASLQTLMVSVREQDLSQTMTRRNATPVEQSVHRVGYPVLTPHPLSTSYSAQAVYPVLKGGSCISANCNGTAYVVTSLGVCLSDLVVVPQGSGSAAPLPSITGLTQPTVVTQTSSKRLQWWEILLMALGCAFIFLAVIWCWRRMARKQRAKRTKAFAQAKNIDQSTSWRRRLVRFGEKLFGHRASKRAYPEPTLANPGLDSEALNAEEARHNQEMEKLMLISDYQYPPEKRSSYYPPSVLPSLYDVGRSRDRLRAVDSAASRLSGPSLYSQVTGVPRNGLEARQPVKKDLITSRFSASSYPVFHKKNNYNPKSGTYL
ncbi:hypothetical protein GG344DRAFT_71283 [Lentinula edodes]|nr:hypothetical protein GG344DRAFT_71283 [Lentinula edodes]